MTTTLSFKSANFEPVYGWLEQRTDVQVDVWGLENGRRAALLAYRDGPSDEYGWSNWAAGAYQDPSELMPLFEDVELETASDAAATSLKIDFPGVFTTKT